MDYKNRIVSDHKILLGKPVIKGTRISVELILKKLSQGASMEELSEMYPHITQEDLLAVRTY
ncbi:MAG: DUF433 domain-containing protein [Sphingobacteriaceae bacterium]|nr:DUF433 domain-containing protein [Sphingobacteriaceae bacterium]